MQLEQHIAKLLYTNYCVIVPEFGGFLANAVSARWDGDTSILQPASKAVGFNQKLTHNDGLLATHIARELGLEQSVALQKVLAVAESWKKQLQQGQVLKLADLGSLQMNSGQKISFDPLKQNNYLLDSFGFASVSAIPIKRETLKKEVEKMEERLPLKITPQKRKSVLLRPWFRYAAIVLLFGAAAATTYLGYNEYKKTQLGVVEDAEATIAKQLQQATFFDTEPFELPALDLNVQKVLEEGNKHHIVAGSFRSKANADAKVKALLDSGFKASYIGTNAYGLHQVAFASFSDKSKARSELKKIQQNTASDAWILTKN